MKKRDMDLTVGNIGVNLIRFALPLLLGNLFQQLYNMVDTWVIGQSGDNGAYAAVGSIGPVINTLIGFFSGLATGSGVVISQYFGAKDEKKVHRAVHTAMMLTVVFAVVFSFLGYFLAPQLAGLMLKTGNSDPSVLASASVYLRIYFAGCSGLMVYNMGAGILRAVGDSDRPFYFLIVSTVTNIVLDLVFVNRLHMGAAGVALATIISQFVSAILVMYVLMTTDSVVRVSVREIRFDPVLLKAIVIIGIPTAIQLSITAFSNVFVQSYIAGANGEQAILLGGWTTYSKVDQFIFLPITSLGLAVSTFVGQCLGKNDVKRAKKGTFIAYLMATGITLVVLLLVELKAPAISAIFNPDQNVVETAAMLLRRLTPFYLFCCVNQVFLGSLRGSGDSAAAMVITLTSFVALRQVYLFIMSHYISNELLPIGFGYPVGWMLCCIGVLIYFFTADYGAKRLVKQES